MLFTTENSVECSLSEVLVFVTGASAVPPLGFGKDIKIEFLDNPKAILPTASTCDLILRIPTAHGEDFASFSENMVLALKGNDGFGAV